MSVELDQLCISTIRTLAIDATAGLHLELPTDLAFLHADLGHDSSAALDRAERGG